MTKKEIFRISDGLDRVLRAHIFNKTEMKSGNITKFITEAIKEKLKKEGVSFVPD